MRKRDGTCARLEGLHLGVLATPAAWYTIEMRPLPIVLGLLMAACASKPTAPEITALDYSPMQLPYGVASAVGGHASFRDPDGDCHQIAIGVIAPDGTLKEAAPVETGTDHRLIATVPFSLTVTPTQHGAHQLSIRFIDDTGLSSTPELGAIDVP